MLEAPEHTAKTVFVVGRDPPDVLQSKLAKFGHIPREDSASLGRRLAAAARTRRSGKHRTSAARYLVPVAGHGAAREPCAREVADLILWGEVDRTFLRAAASKALARPYVLIRRQVQTCLELFEDGERDVVVRAGMGNGKTLLLESLAAVAPRLGYRVLMLADTGPGVIAEVDQASAAGAKALLLVDGYTSEREAVAAFALNRAEQHKAVYSARPDRHADSGAWLHHVLGTSLVPELDLDTLGADEAALFAAALSSHGLSGEASTPLRPSHATPAPIAPQSFAGLLAAGLEAPPLAARLQACADALARADRDSRVALCAAIVLSLMDLSVDYAALGRLTGVRRVREILHSSPFGEAKLVDTERSRVGVRNAFVAQQVLRRGVAPAFVVDVLVSMATHAHDLREESDQGALLRSLMACDRVATVFSREHRAQAVPGFYTRLERLAGCAADPEFWHQYAQAKLSLEAFDDAGSLLALARARAAGNGFDPTVLDITEAELVLRRLIARPARDRDVAIAAFRRAHAVVYEHLGKSARCHLPYRVAMHYRAFAMRHDAVLTDADRLEAIRAARFVRRRITALPPYRAGRAEVSACAGALDALLARARG